MAGRLFIIDGSWEKRTAGEGSSEGRGEGSSEGGGEGSSEGVGEVSRKGRGEGRGSKERRKE